MVSSIQIRAGRALLKWTAQDLANKAGVAVSTIRRIELIEGVPNINKSTLLAIKLAFESAHVEFIGEPDKNPGVRVITQRDT